MLGGCEVENIFLREYLLVVDVIAPKLDFSVMKALQREIPLLTKQEHLHAKMHNQAQAERRRRQEQADMKRWAWFISLADLFLLRLGKEICGTTAGFIEVSAPTWMFLSMSLPWNKGFANNEYVFHSMEELEHGELTTQFLRTKVHPLSSLLLLPVVVVVFGILFLAPPVMVLVCQPLQFFKLKNVGPLIRYYATFVPVFLATVLVVVFCWVLPFRMDDGVHRYMYNYFLGVVEDRGIEFDIVDKETYRIENSTVIAGQD